jgi:membrane-bound lytic murein transglycosylase D
MKRILLIFSSCLAIFSANAQNPIKSIQKDSTFNKIAAKADTIAMPIIDQPLFFNQNLIYKLRLDSIVQTVPLSYNEYVQSFIDKYTKRKALIGKMLGLSG